MSTICKKMDGSPAVRLRLRIVKLKGPESRLQDDIILICGRKLSRLPPHASEWLIFELDSSDDKIVFQTTYGTASCKCRDFDGRRRLDFSPDVSLLIEGYWTFVSPEHLVLTPQAEATTQTTQHCQIKFQATRGAPGYDPIITDNGSTDFMQNFGMSATAPDELPEPAGSDNGPVSRALEWLRDEKFALPSDYSKAPVPKEQRTVYFPSDENAHRIRWSQELTAMKASGRHSRLDVLMKPVEKQTKLNEIIRNVNTSLNLKKMYLTIPDV